MQEGHRTRRCLSDRVTLVIGGGLTADQSRRLELKCVGCTPGGRSRPSTHPLPFQWVAPSRGTVHQWSGLPLVWSVITRKGSERARGLLTRDGTAWSVLGRPSCRNPQARLAIPHISAGSGVASVNSR
jgi:hypothetical protein